MITIRAVGIIEFAKTRVRLPNTWNKLQPDWFVRYPKITSRIMQKRRCASRAVLFGTRVLHVAGISEWRTPWTENATQEHYLLTLYVLFSRSQTYLTILSNSIRITTVFLLQYMTNHRFPDCSGYFGWPDASTICSQDQGVGTQIYIGPPTLHS